MRADAQRDPRLMEPEVRARQLRRRVRSHVDAEIASGRWMPGDAVPSNQRLAARLDVPRHTVLTVIEQLAAEGVLVREGPGRPVRVGGVAARPPLPAQETVERFIRAQLASRRWQLGDELPSQVALARLLGVSPATVQRAVRALAAAGLLSRPGERRRPVVMWASPANAAPRSRVDAYVRRQIAGGTLKPGDALPTREWLARTLHVPATAVRAAVARLAAEGVVTPHGLVTHRRLHRRIGPRRLDYDAVALHICAAVAARRWAPGDELPSAEALGRELGVSAAAVRTALQQLADDGILRRPRPAPPISPPAG